MKWRVVEACCEQQCPYFFIPTHLIDTLDIAAPSFAAECPSGSAAAADANTNAADATAAAPAHGAGHHGGKGAADWIWFASWFVSVSSTFGNPACGQLYVRSAL